MAKGLRIDLAPGDELHVSGGARICIEQKTGRRTAVRVIADEESRLQHVKAKPADSAADPLK